jgi:two-component system, NarL family, nitrate/nitrite response regulator NarL
MSAAETRGKGPVKILTADDHPLLREALARLIAEIGTSVEVLEADSLRAAEDLLAANRDWALVILDVMLPDATGIEAAERVLNAHPDVPLLVVSAKDDPATARAVLDTGARGFISKRSPTRVLAEAIRLVLVGGTHVPPEALLSAPPPEQDADSTPDDPDAPPSAARLALGLTARQFDVLALLIQGAPNKLIGRTLQLAEGTVKAHIAAIYRSLKVANRTQAVYVVRCLGIAVPNTGLWPAYGPRTGDVCNVPSHTVRRSQTTSEPSRPAPTEPGASFANLLTGLGRPAAFEGA